MKNDFDKIAWLYDTLAKLVFGESLNLAQKQFLSEIPSNANLLIVGGGTGWILKALDKINKPLNVLYVDQSKKMIASAKRKAPFENLQVTFKAESYENQSEMFDVIITNFFLDVFTEKNLSSVVHNLRSKLKPGGKWLVTDFEKDAGWWQNSLISSMYLFFRFTTNLEGDKLLDFDYWLKKNQLKEISSTAFYYGMIKSSVYKAL